QINRLRSSVQDSLRKIQLNSRHSLKKIFQRFSTSHSYLRSEIANHKVVWLSMNECLAVRQNEVSMQMITQHVNVKKSSG
ncbi:MAG TPA: hypothetical protein VF338_00180, partial [Leptolinea sp.]